MKSTQDIIEHIDISSDYMLDHIISALERWKYEHYKNTVYICQDLITEIGFPIIKLYFVEYSEGYIYSLREKLQKLGYKCTSVKESSGVPPLRLPTGLYFTVIFQISFFQKIKNILKRFYF